MRFHRSFASVLCASLFLTACESDAGAGNGEADGDAGDADSSTNIDGDAASSACSNDEECGAEFYCSVSAVCLPRCDQELGCASVKPANIEDLPGAWADEFTWAQVGADGSRELWRWNADDSAPATYKPLDKPPVSEAVVCGDHEYLHSFSDMLRRPAATGAMFEVYLQYQVHEAWRTGSFYWWTRGTSEGSQLWRVACTPGSEPEMIRQDEHGAWDRGTDDFAISINNNYDTPAIRITPGDGSADRTIKLQFRSMPFSLHLHEDYVVVPSSSCAYHAYDLRTGATKFAGSLKGPPRLYHPECISWSFTRRGDWFVVAATQRDVNVAGITQPKDGWESTWLVGRQHVDGTAEQLAMGRTGISARLARTGRHLSYWHLTEKRFFQHEVPGYPCSETMLCPDGLICAADMSCH